MPNACIALFFEKTVYLIQEKDESWNFPGGKLKPREDALEGAFREFQEEIGNNEGSNLFNLKKWARDTGNIFTPHYVHHSNDVVGRPHTTIFYCICKSKPVFTFRRNNETINGNWFDVYNLPQPLKYRSISELTQKVSNPVRSIHHMDRDVDVPGFIGFTSASALSASAPPLSDDDDNDDDVEEAIRLSLQDMPPPPSYDDIGQYSVLPFQKKRGGTIKNKNKGGKGRKKNKMRKNIKSLKKYKKNKKNI
jgi:8-oxo-dGTP pyrophosphatase MutT (NUDIX family)